VWFSTVSEQSKEFASSGNGGCGGARCSREEGRATAFYRRGRAGEVVRELSHTMATAWAQHGTRQQRRARGRAANGVRRHGRSACEGAARGTSQGSTRIMHRSTRHDARTGGRRPASACGTAAYDHGADMRHTTAEPMWRARVTSRARDVPACEQFALGCFDHDFLPIFELKCTLR
jgi:hypothetical protein